MTNHSFAELHGFSADPFASTNSEDEELLEEYFVPPPYFSNVIGDPQAPKPKVIFAPRGSGKTAQRRMIEVASLDEETPFVCITYDQFDNVGNGPLSTQDHLVAICRLLTVTVLEYLDRRPEQAADLSDHQKRVLKVAGETFAGGMSQSEYNRAFSSIKSLGDHATEIWHKYGGVIAAGITIAMKKAGLDDISIPAQLRQQASNLSESARYFYEQLVEIIAEPLRGGSIYILVDKVDETPYSSADPSRAWEIISALILDLPTLEKKEVGFKIFLWDQVKSSFLEAGSRGDRLQPVTLSWDNGQLSKMLSRRLKAYSERKTESFNQLTAEDLPFDAHELLARLAEGSPREMIRMAEAVAAENTRVKADHHAISRDEFLRGVRNYSSARSEELYGTYLSDLRKIGSQSFTINHIANNVFNISNQAARSKIQKWVNSGAVLRLGEISNGKKKPLHLYGLSSIKLLIALSPQFDVLELLENFTFACETCGTVTIMSETRLVCPGCHVTLSISKTPSIMTAGSENDD